jgi:D-mannonate dehydratase
LIKDNAGIIEKQTQRLLELKKSFDSGVTLQTAIVTFRIQEDVSKMRKSFSSDPHAVWMFVDQGV